MPGLRLRLKPVLATVILLTAIFLISGLTLQFAAPALSLIGCNRRTAYDHSQLSGIRPDVARLAHQ